MLRQIGEAQTATRDDLTGVGFFLASKQPEQGGLAGAIGANEADAGALVYGQVELVQDAPAAVELGDAGEAGDQHSGYSSVGGSCGGRDRAGRNGGVRADKTAASPALAHGRRFHLRVCEAFRLR